MEETHDRLRTPFAIGVFVFGVIAAIALGDAWYFLTGIIAAFCLQVTSA